MEIQREDAACLAQRRKKSERLRWEVEKERLSMRQVRLTARDRLWLELEQCDRAAANAAVAAAKEIRERKYRAATEALLSAEERYASSIRTEERTRWEKLMYSFSGASCVSASRRDVQAVRGQCELIAAELLLQRQQQRLGGPVEEPMLPTITPSEDSSESKVFPFRVVLVNVEESDARKALTAQWLLTRHRLQQWEHREAQVCQAHDRRRAEERLQHIREKEMVTKRYASTLLLQRVGRCFVWRLRLHGVWIKREDVTLLVERHRQQHKQWLLEENVERGDLYHYMVLVFKQRFPQEFPSLFRHSELYPWDPSVLIPVETLGRERVLDEELKVNAQMRRVFAEAAAEIARMPRHLIGRRERAAVSIQRAWRSSVLRRTFGKEHRDALLLAKALHLDWRFSERLVSDTETAGRRDIIAEYEATDWVAMKLEAANISRQRWAAAVQLQRVTRGWLWRRCGLLACQEEVYTGRLAALRDRAAMRRPRRVD
jgi:hypothetical protein